MIADFLLLHPSLSAAIVAVFAGVAGMLRLRVQRTRTSAAAPSNDSFPYVVLAAAVWAIPFGALAALLAHVPSAVGQAAPIALGTVAALFAIIAAHRCAIACEPGRRLLLTTIRLAILLALLLIIARPVWDWTVTEWRKPRLTVLLDNSRSMDIADMPVSGSPDGPSASLETRAAVVRRAFAAAEDDVARLAELYDLDVRELAGRATTRPAPRETWEISPTQPISPLASAIRESVEAEISDDRKPVAVILISDGAETSENDAAVRAAAAKTEAAGVALYTVGAAPAAAVTRGIELDPLDLPARISSRDRVTGDCVARVRGYDGGTAQLTLRWDDDVASTTETRLDSGDQRLSEAFDLPPPGPGLHRFSATVSVRHPNLPDAAAEVHAAIEVVDGAIRVLMLDGSPRTENAFVTRAILGDPRFELTRKFLPRTPDLVPTEETVSAETWHGFDVVLIGFVPRWRLTQRAMESLRDAVTQRGVGLLLAGGGPMFSDGTFAGTPLDELAPAELRGRDPAGLARSKSETRFTPTSEGVIHAVLRQSADAEADRKLWAELPPLGAASPLESLKPLAAVLARDAGGRALLAAHEVGAGRCLAAGWESTWAWALASDRGLELHRRIWRQMVEWLANRRPRAWILPDDTIYTLESLRAGGRKVLIRAGVSGASGGDARRATGGDVFGAAGGVNAASRPSAASSDLRLPADAASARDAAAQPAARGTAAFSGAAAELKFGDSAPVSIPLRATPDGWEAEVQPTAAGEYRISFSVVAADAGSSPASAVKLTAGNSFRVLDIDLEHRPPTANLDLLRQSAAITSDRGGAYVHISEWRDLVRRLADVDRRKRVEQQVRYDPVDRGRKWLLAAVAALLCVEWVLRKRGGLV